MGRLKVWASHLLNGTRNLSDSLSITCIKYKKKLKHFKKKKNYKSLTLIINKENITPTPSPSLVYKEKSLKMGSGWDWIGNMQQCISFIWEINDRNWRDGVVLVNKQGY